MIYFPPHHRLIVSSSHPRMQTCGSGYVYVGSEEGLTRCGLTVKAAPHFYLPSKLFSCSRRICTCLHKLNKKHSNATLTCNFSIIATAQPPHPPTLLFKTVICRNCYSKAKLIIHVFPWGTNRNSGKPNHIYCTLTMSTDFTRATSGLNSVAQICQRFHPDICSGY